MRSEELLKESSVGIAHAALYDFIRSATVEVSAVHLIHRGAVPLQHKARLRQPSRGRTIRRSELGRVFECRALPATADLIHRGAVPLPLIGEGINALGNLITPSYSGHRY